VFELAAALSAYLAGDVDQELVHTAALAQRPRFALGLSAAARMSEMDPTRPENMNRDRARSLHLRAVTVDPTWRGLGWTWRAWNSTTIGRARPPRTPSRRESAAADWWPAALQLADALRARGLERDADVALADAWRMGKPGRGRVPSSMRGFGVPKSEPGRRTGTTDQAAAWL